MKISGKIEKIKDNKSETYELEEGTGLKIDFNKLAKVSSRCNNVIPVAVQNADTMEVILIAYTNREAFDYSIKSKTATFWSTSRNELWIKGDGSGNRFELIEVRVNCEQNSLVYIVRQQGEGICHTKNSDGKARDCYYRKLNLQTGDLENLDS